MCTSEQPIVAIESGLLKGSTKLDCKNKIYYSFQGIPYAKPPIDDLRFKAPQPPESWSGVRDATKAGSMCYSRHLIFRSLIGSEDCLFLNVYTPELPPANNGLKPVMFWIHGGGFTMGSGDIDFFGPNYLISEDVVIVTINYRLGLLGFLSFDDVSLGITGNAGLKDQVMALQWVKKNIANFGGDPNNVTIFGESAGGASVHYLILSPLAKGLFHKAILQSASVFSLWARGQRTTSALATVLGMENANEQDIYKSLKSMTVEKIFQLQEKIPDMFEADFARIIGPVIENKDAEEPFLALDPLEVIRSGKYNQVPMIIGFTSREGMLSAIDSKRSCGEVIFPSDFEKLIPSDLKVPKGTDLSKSLSQKIKNFYFASQESSSENIDQYYLLHGDVFFVYGIYTTVKLHSTTSDTPIYFYRVNLDSKLNVYKRFGQITDPGTCHGDDVGYLFTNIMSTPLLPNSVESKAVARFVKLWTSFARNGNPNSDIISVVWKSIEGDKCHYLEIGDNLTVGLNPEQERMTFWDEIYALRTTHCN